MVSVKGNAEFIPSFLTEHRQDDSDLYLKTAHV